MIGYEFERVNMSSLYSDFSRQVYVMFRHVAVVAGAILTKNLQFWTGKQYFSKLNAILQRIRPNTLRKTVINF